MRVVSTFSGISAATVAWRPLGFQFAAYAEIDPFACRILRKHCGASAPRYLPEGTDHRLYKQVQFRPNEGIPNLGDITQVTDDDLRALGPVDVLEGGSPCQDFSVAGLRKGLDGERGNMTLVFARLAARMRRLNGLRWVVWENVRGALNDRTNAFGCLAAALVGELSGPLKPPGRKWTDAGTVSGPEGDLAWRVLDAERFGLAASRARVYVVASVADGRSCSGSEVLFEQASDPWVIVEQRQGGAFLADRIGFDIDRSGVGPVYAGSADSKGSWRLEKAYSLKATADFNPPVVAYRRNGRAVVRRMLPSECELMLGFPGYWTELHLRYKALYDQFGERDRYRTLGNSMSIPTIRAIGERLKMAHVREIAQAA